MGAVFSRPQSLGGEEGQPCRGAMGGRRRPGGPGAHNLSHVRVRDGQPLWASVPPRQRGESSTCPAVSVCTAQRLHRLYHKQVYTLRGLRGHLSVRRELGAGGQLDPRGRNGSLSSDDRAGAEPRSLQISSSKVWRSREVGPHGLSCKQLAWLCLGAMTTRQTRGGGEGVQHRMQHHSQG